MYDEYGNKVGSRYTVRYKASLYEDETKICDGWNSVDEDDWNKAHDLYKWCESNDIDVEINDNYYDVLLSKGEWN